MLRRPALVRKLARYASASVIATATSMTVLATLVATGAMAAGWATRGQRGTTGRTVASEGANVATFATLWVVEYGLFDRVLFRARHVPTTAAVDLADQAEAPARPVGELVEAA